MPKILTAWLGAARGSETMRLDMLARLRTRCVNTLPRRGIETTEELIANIEPVLADLASANPKTRKNSARARRFGPQGETFQRAKEAAAGFRAISLSPRVVLRRGMQEKPAQGLPRNRSGVVLNIVVSVRLETRNVREENH